MGKSFQKVPQSKERNRKWINKAIDEGQYVFKNYTPHDFQTSRMQTEDVLTTADLKHYEAEIEAMNLILISISNEIYNSVDACTTAKAMEARFNNEFDQFVAEPGEALVSIYNRFAQLMNDLERNGITFPLVTVNTKFLNCLQPEWLKYVTQVRLAKRLTEDTYDDSFDYLQQFEKLVNASRAKNGCPQRESSLVDYDDEYQGDAFQNNYEDPLTSAMMLLACAITQRFSNPTNNHLHTSSNTRNQAIVQADKNDARNTHRTLRTTSSGSATNVQCYNCSEKGHYARNYPKPRVRDSKYFMEQMLLAKHDEAGVTLTDEHNDFFVADVTRMEEIEELSANICLMVRIQPANIDSDAGPSYDSAFLSEVQKPSTGYVNPLFSKDNQEQKYLKQPKIINDTIGDDQIDSNIIFDAPNIDVNSGSVEYDNNAQASYALEKLALNAYKEAEKQQINANKVQQQKQSFNSTA
ncbi:integrase, catalytic region, zinc finger, CCHC-type containing protein [Tanacetum coccineum]|uniref:Integrase, catalytic region, zinc finger, CCHC-type containing protein n=1 Tax=Tanacetum coccineum TaxID=301880 RepID=A0ABQ5HBX1_9ASTR